ncbi:hypothetical protein DFH07DRAFT_869890 [Mycena maculata]|uniref:JmjC domain-containing protein n=1 Tax=Mycena maculata TaxID=230809 RepID=A0AAD7IL06_9AGAR|nr:hypothetical protein DFH07DRAFT_869890 [Mycena maculata]
MTSIFVRSWMCRCCGQEVCNECFEDLKELVSERPGDTSHDTIDDFVPVTRFTKSELENTVQDMCVLLGHENLTEDIFRPLWAKGDPLLVTDVGARFKVPWNPRYFIDTYGSQRCEVIECQQGRTRDTTVGHFPTSERVLIWPQDWPPSSDFEMEFPQLFQDFNAAVPMPNYVRRDGVLNLTSHFPSNTIVPDLGPKMYNAYANLTDRDSKGTTQLHIDMLDALNIMTYASLDSENKDGRAVWDLFRAQDSNKIRRFLQAKFPKNSGDPIHGQEVYLDDNAWRDLWTEHGVKSYRVYQTPGDAIFIPAGCAHQVRNLSDCIKVAIDFVSPENIKQCEKLTQEFRQENTRIPWKEDVLQLRTMMWFAWLSCCRQEKLAVSRK